LTHTQVRALFARTCVCFDVPKFCTRCGTHCRGSVAAITVSRGSDKERLAYQDTVVAVQAVGRWHCERRFLYRYRYALRHLQAAVRAAPSFEQQGNSTTPCNNTGTVRDAHQHRQRHYVKQ